MKSILIAIFALMLIPLSGRSMLPSVQLDQWEITHPKPNGAWFYAVTWGDEGCVGVGMNGEIAFSPDGNAWKAIPSPFHQAEATKNVILFDVCYGNGIYIAVGGLYNRGYVARSNDGENWEVFATSSPQYLRGVSYGDGRFVAVVDKTIITSTDGLTWQALPDSPGIQKITYGEGRWVGLGGGGRYCYSDDLASWNTSASNPFPLLIQSGITYGAGKFLSVGGFNSDGSPSVIEWSEDGISWNSISSVGDEYMWGVLQGCAYVNGVFVAVGAERNTGYHTRNIYTSTDAISWANAQSVSPSNVHAPSGYLTDVAGYDEKPFIAVSSIGEIWKSPDGMNWTVTDPAPREYLKKIKYEGSTFVAVGGRTDYIGGPSGAAAIFTSHNGIDWQAYIPERHETLSDVMYGDGIWVATGDDGGIFTSQDGVNWVDRSWPATTNDLDIAVYGAGRFVAFSKGRDRIYHSEDSIVWDVSDGAPVAGVECAAFINDEFIACGENGLILVSTDGLSWVDRSLGSDVDITAISYGKGRYVLSGSNSVAVSTNGLDWEIVEEDLAPGEIHYAGGWFIGSNLKISRDGLHWYPSISNFYPDYSHLESMVIVGDRLVSIDGIELWTAVINLPQFDELTLFLNGGLEQQSRSGKIYRLLQSTDLNIWEPHGPWVKGSDDYLLWEADYLQPYSFWRLEESSQE